MVQPTRMVWLAGYIIFTLSCGQPSFGEPECLSNYILVVGIGFLVVVSMGAGIIRKEIYTHSIVQSMVRGDYGTPQSSI